MSYLNELLIFSVIINCNTYLICKISLSAGPPSCIYWYLTLMGLVCPELPVSLDCLFLIAPTVFSKVYLMHNDMYYSFRNTRTLTGNMKKKLCYQSFFQFVLYHTQLPSVIRYVVFAIKVKYQFIIHIIIRKPG
jgi:hypothetical protein